MTSAITALRDRLLHPHHRRDGDERQGDHDVHERSGEEDQEALPLRLGEELVRIPGHVLLGGIARHAHVAAQRDQRHAIVRVALSEAEQPLSEAEGEDEHSHAKELRHEEVPRFVHEDQDAENDEEADVR